MASMMSLDSASLVDLATAEILRTEVSDGIIAPGYTAEALEVLTRAYANTLREFLTSERTVLRLLPISGGIFAGAFLEAMPELTRPRVSGRVGGLGGRTSGWADGP